MQKKHITDSTACNGKEHLAFPQMYTSGYNDGNKFWNSMISLQDVYISYTVDNQHTQNGRWKEFSQILYKCGCFPVFIK